MGRKEVCQKIRDLNLQDAVKQHYGDNYTRVSTDKLEKLVKAYDKSATNAGKPAPAPVKPEAKPAEKKADNATSTNNPYEAACLVFLGILKDSDLLDGLLAKL